MDKIVYREGYTCHDLGINDKSSKEYSEEFKMELYMKLIDSFCDSNDLDDLLIDLCLKYGKSKFCFHCEGCGDDVYEYTLKIW